MPVSWPAASEPCLRAWAAGLITLRSAPLEAWLTVATITLGVAGLHLIAWRGLEERGQDGIEGDRFAKA